MTQHAVQLCLDSPDLRLMRIVGDQTVDLLQGLYPLSTLVQAQVLLPDRRGYRQCYSGRYFGTDIPVPAFILRNHFNTTGVHSLIPS